MAATGQAKKIDLLFVIDNSSSMSTEIQHVRDGFNGVASDYFDDPNLDICLAIITTNRYLGATGTYQNANAVPQALRGTPYPREMIVGCSGAMTSTALINSFHQKMSNIGDAWDSNTGCELPGKSMATFMYNQANFPAVNTSNLSANPLNPFFRNGAVVGLNFATDENNWNQTCSDNSTRDLPPVQNAVYTGTTQDTRKGIKDVVADAIGRVSNQGISPVSIMNFLLTSGDERALNLANLVGVPNFANYSVNADINGDVNYYKGKYTDLLQGLVTQANSFTLAHPVATTTGLVVTLHRSNGTDVVLLLNQDFTLTNGNTKVQLDQTIVSGLAIGDQLQVQYYY